MSNVLYMLIVSMSDVLAVYVGMWPSMYIAIYDALALVFSSFSFSCCQYLISVSDYLSGCLVCGAGALSLSLDLDLFRVFTDERCMS